MYMKPTPAKIGDANAGDAGRVGRSACKGHNVRYNQVRPCGCQPGLLRLQQRSPLLTPCYPVVALHGCCAPTEPDISIPMTNVRLLCMHSVYNVISITLYHQSQEKIH